MKTTQKGNKKNDTTTQNSMLRKIKKSKMTLFNCLNESYSTMISERIVQSIRAAKVLKGKNSNSRPILGLNSCPNTPGIYSINNQEQKVVIDIYEQFSKAESIIETIDYCKKQKYKTKRLSKNRGGKDFTPGSLKSLLKSQMSRGWNEFKDEFNQFPELQDGNGMIRWEYAHEPLVPESLIQKVDKVFEKIATGKKELRKSKKLIRRKK